MSETSKNRVFAGCENMREKGVCLQNGLPLLPGVAVIPSGDGSSPPGGVAGLPGPSDVCRKPYETTCKTLSGGAAVAHHAAGLRPRLFVLGKGCLQ